jgi:hypothetical protein
MAATSYRQWSVDDVTKWLESIHLHSLIPTFERLNISGSDLPQLDDGFLREKLRITKPAEMIALKGAISNLTDAPAATTNRKVSNAVGGVKPLERSGSFERKKTYPLSRKTTSFTPTTMPRNFTVAGGEKESIVGTREPQLKKGASAPEVLDDRCRYSGWIRKQGGGYKNWRKRYLVLRLGCLYYFANETAKEPKGCFTLAGYHTEICNDPEILKKQKWTLKVEPVNGALRTYYVSVGAKRELHAWKQAIDEEIAACARRPKYNDRVPGGGVVVADVGAIEEVGEGSSDEEGDDEEPIYDQPDEGDEDFNEDGESPIYDRPDDEEEDDPYCEISEEVIPGLRPPSPHATLPTTPKGGPLAVKSFKGIDDWELAPEHRVLGGGKGGRPTVPMRSPVSLGLDQKQAPPMMVGRGGSHEEMGEETYLPIIGSGPSESSSSITSEKTKLYSPPHNPIMERPELDQDYEDDKALDGEDYGGDDSDAYYVVFRKPEELMPPSCLFDNLDRAEADRLLRAKGVNGTYLIRAGSRAGSEKVLSVWHEDRCRHYKLFKDEVLYYAHLMSYIATCLTRTNSMHLLPTSKRK